MQNKTFTVVVALTSTLTTNILNPPTVTGGTNCGSSPCYVIIRQVTVVNKGNTSGTFTFYRGATGANAAGTEVIGFGTPVNTGAAFEKNTAIRLDSTDYLVGGASGLRLTTDGLLADFVFAWVHGVVP